VSPARRSTTTPATSPETPVEAARAPRRARPAASLALILTAAFMVVLDFSIVNVALAAIERELHVGPTSAQWVITAYAITFGGLLVLGGRVGDLFGRRRMFVVGLVVFSAASLAGGFATGITMLVAARAVQGLGAAIVAPAALSLVTTSTPDGAARTRALGLYGATASLGFVAGLVLGGLLVQFLDWRAVLWVNVPIGVAAALLAPLLLPAPPCAADRPRLDLVGALLVTAGVASVVYGISQGPVRGWSSPTTVIPIVAAGALVYAFVRVERRHPSPLVRLGVLRIPALRAANLVTVLLGAWGAGELLVVPLYLQFALHYSPLLTGLAIAPQGVLGFLGAARGAQLVRALGLRAFLAATGVSAGLGLGLLGLLLTTRSYPLLLAGLALAGFGTAGGAFGATVAATRGIEDGEQGLASGLVNMSRQLGAAIGVAIVAAIVGTTSGGGSTTGPDRVALGLLALTGFAAALLAWRGLAHLEGASRVRLHSLASRGQPGRAQRRAPEGAVATVAVCESSSLAPVEAPEGDWNRRSA